MPEPAQGAMICPAADCRVEVEVLRIGGVRLRDADVFEALLDALDESAESAPDLQQLIDGYHRTRSEGDERFRSELGDTLAAHCFRPMAGAFRVLVTSDG